MPARSHLSFETALVLSRPDMRAFAALLKADHAKWGKIVREAGIKVE